MKLIFTFKFFLLAACLSLFTDTLAAQDVTIYVESETFQTDDTIRVNVRGINLDTIAGAEFSLTWDTLVLRYEGVDNVNMDDLGFVGFNVSQLDSGRVGVQLFDATLEGFEIEDEAILLAMKFVSLTNVTTTTALSFGDMPLRRGTFFGNQETATSSFVDGNILIEAGTGVPAVAEDERLVVRPNPITDQASLRIDLNYGGKATVHILDVSGRVVKQLSFDLIAGGSTHQLNADLFPSSGTYFVRVTTDREQITRKVIRR